jgi:hypothetical protein
VSILEGAVAGTKFARIYNVKNVLCTFVVRPLGTSPVKGLIASRDGLWLFGTHPQRPKQTRLHWASLTRLVYLALLRFSSRSTYLRIALPYLLCLTLHTTYLHSNYSSPSSDVQPPKKSPDSNILPVILSSCANSRYSPRILLLLHVPCPLLSVTLTMASL